MTESQDSPAAEFFDALEEQFERAVRGAGNRPERRFRVGEKSLCFEFAGPELVSTMTLALEHLSDLDPVVGEPDLTVRLFDTASTGCEAPRPPWPADAQAARGEVRGLSTESVQVSYWPGPGTLFLFRPERRVGLFWVASRERIPAWESAAPLRPILGWWAASAGRSLAHAAAVGLPDAGAILLTGRGGSGKSTTALACCERGFSYLGDDYVLLDGGGETVRVHSLFCTGKLFANDMQRRLPTYAAKVLATDSLADHPKAVVSIQQFSPERLAASMPLRAIVVPRVSERGRTTIRRASPIEVLKALAPTTAFQLPGAGGETLQTLADLARILPGFALELGPDLDEIAERLRRVIVEDAP